MEKSLYQKFASTIAGLSAAELAGSSTLYEKMEIAREGKISVCYAPFEHVNKEARVVIVGITPGHTQMLNALHEAQRQIKLGASEAEILKAAKSFGAFSGTIRPNLTSLLDTIQINKWLKLKSCDALFSSAANLVQTTSVLRNPVFVDGANYSGTPNMLRSPLLRKQIVESFGKEAASLSKAVFIPLGDKVAEALHFLAQEGVIERNRILDGIPHPSGANAERVAYFTGKKAKELLSVKTSAEKLDAARVSLVARVAAL